MRPDHLHGGLGQGVMGARAVGRKVRVKGVVLRNQGLDELVQYLPADGFAGIRGVLSAVALSDEGHDIQRDTPGRAGRGGPRIIRPDAAQREQRQR